MVDSSIWVTEKDSDRMIYRALGSTGERVSSIGLGGFHIGNPLLESMSIKTMRAAIDGGLPFMDNCWESDRSIS